MASRWLTRLLCLLALVGVVASLGCGTNPFSPERVNRRRYVMCTDLNHMWDDIDWALGLNEPSILYEDSMLPGP